MLENSIYVNVNLDSAAMKCNEIVNLDNDRWFYKKWRSNLKDKNLDAPLPQLDHIESLVEQRMKEEREGYRKLTENMRMPHPAARPFNEQKEIIEDSMIFKIFREMPKCGLLHVHSTVALSVERLLELLEKWEGRRIDVVVRASKATPIIGKLFYHGDGDVNPDCVEDIKIFLANPMKKRWLKSLLSFASPSRTEAIPYIWDEFNEIFLRTEQLFGDRDFYLQYHVYAFQEMMDDHIDYVELRCGFQNFTNKSADESGLYAGYSPEFLDVIMEAERCVNEKAVNPIKVRVILNARRDLDPLDDTVRKKLIYKIDAAILWRQLADYRELIVGFDFVSEEDRGNYTYAFFHEVIYSPAFYDFKADQDNPEGPPILTPYGEADLVAREDLKAYIAGCQTNKSLRIQLIDFYLHDGESVWADSQNIIDAVTASYRRVGHGFNMAKFPVLVNHIGGLKMIQPTDASDAAPVGPILEICPISNQLLRYFPDLRNHAAYELMKQGVQCVISNDDPQILCNPGLSYDYWEAYVGLQLDLQAIKGLLFNSFICRQLADRRILEPEKDGISLKEYDQMIEIFRNNYWIPFIMRAAKLLGMNI